MTKMEKIEKMIEAAEKFRETYDELYDYDFCGLGNFSKRELHITDDLMLHLEVKKNVSKWVDPKFEYVSFVRNGWTIFCLRKCENNDTKTAST